MQDRKQEAFQRAIDEAYRLWNTGAMTMIAASKLAAKKYKVNADGIAQSIFDNRKK
jgi:hypothetical protein